MARKYQVRISYFPECGCCSDGWDLEELFDNENDAELAGARALVDLDDNHMYFVNQVELVDNSNKPS